MLALLLRRPLRVERNDRQQFLGIREHLLLDHDAQLFVARPHGVLPGVRRPRTQHEVHDLVAVILRIADPGRLLDLLQFRIQRGAVEALARVVIAEFLILDPEVRIRDVAVEDVLPVLRIRFEISRLDLLANEVRIARREHILHERQVFLLGLRRELLAFDLLFEHVHQVHGVRRDLARIEVEHARQDLEREACRHARHPFVHARVIAILLVRLRLRIGVLQVFAVIHLHLREQARILRLVQARQHRELRHHLQRARRAHGFGQRRIADQLLVDLRLFRHAQAVRHLHDEDPVEQCLVVAVIAECLPLRLVRVRENHAVERNRAESFGTLEIAFLRRGQERVQHLDRRLEHFDEFEQALVRQAQAARIAVRIGIVLRVLFELADVDLADERRDVLVVLVARLRLCDADLPKDRRIAAHHAELADVAVVFVQALDGPRTQDALQVAAWNAVLLFEDRAVLVVVEQPERRFVDGRTLQRIERHALHQLLQALGDRRLPAAHRAEQVEDLLLFLEPLRSVAEVRDHLLDHFLHSVELTERGIDLDNLVREDPRQARVVAGIDLFRFPDCSQHAFASRGVR
eukprot:RCo054236